MPQVRSVAVAALLACCALTTPALPADATEAPAAPVRELVDGAFKALPQAGPPAASPTEPESAEPAGPLTSTLGHLTKVLPTAPAPAQHAPLPLPPTSPAPGSDPVTSGQGSSPAAAVAGERGGAFEGPVSAHLRGAISAAQGSGDPAAARGEGSRADASLAPRATPSSAVPSRSPAPQDQAGVLAAAPVEGAENQARPQPAALSDWIGSGPPLPPAFVYLAVFASVLAIVVSMRRELGLGPRRHGRL